MAPNTNRSGVVRSSLLGELRDLAKTAAEQPYADLPALFENAGWFWRLRETGVTPMADASVIVHFDVLLGKSPDALEVFDHVSLRLVRDPGPISLAARAALVPTLLYLIFGRLPPPAQAAAAAGGAPNGHLREDRIDMSRGDDDVVLPGERAPRLDEPEQPVLDLVARRTPDGLPILRDPYEIGEPEATTREIIDAIVHAFADFLPSATSVEQLKALGLKNQGSLDFVKDMGTEDDARRLRDMLAARRSELSVPANPEPPPIPRRRRASAPAAD